MPRLCAYLDSESQLEKTAGETTIVLSLRESHHLTVVLRARQGSTLRVTDGNGHIYDAVLHSLIKKQAVLKIVEEHFIPRPHPEIILMIALLKGKAMDNVLRGAAELGVSRLIPLTTDHVEGGSRPGKAKWRQTLQESLKQCANSWLPDLENPHSLTEAVGELKKRGSSGCVAALNEPTHSLWNHLLKMAPQPPNSFFLLIGPEGDFSRAEYRFLENEDIPTVSLGTNILRAETAAIMASGLAIAALRQ